MKNKIVFTKHAKERLKEFNIPILEAVTMVENASPEKAPVKQNKMHQREGKHFRYGTVIFTGVFKPDKFSINSSHIEEIFLVITVYDQRMDLPAELV